jgi:uncharacterized protein (DUF433 family)
VPEALAGKPVIRGTRLCVEFVIGLMADGWTEADILENYPGITHEDIIACLAYARDILSWEKVFPSAARVGLSCQREFLRRSRGRPRGSRAGSTSPVCLGEVAAPVDHFLGGR